jgi:hypothetical protein
MLKILSLLLLCCSVVNATTITFDQTQDDWILNPGIDSSMTIRNGNLQVKTSGAFSTSLSLAHSPWSAFSLKSIDVAELPVISADRIRVTGVDLQNNRTMVEFELDRITGFQTFVMPTGFESVGVVLFRGVGGTGIRQDFSLDNLVLGPAVITPPPSVPEPDASVLAMLGFFLLCGLPRLLCPPK